MDWHYQDPRTGERRGPTSREALAALFDRGELTGDTLVWRIGLTQWTPAAQTPEFGNAARPAAAPPAMSAAAPVAMAMPAGDTIGYYSPRGETPARVRENLRKYAPPTGPVGDWPLNDEHVAQFSQAVQLRKRILSSYNLIRLVAALQAIAFAVMVVVAIGMFAGGGRAAAQAWETLVPGVVIGAMMLLGFACANATWYCRSWGSLVMAILTTIACVLQAASIAITSSASGLPGSAAAAMAVTGAIGLVFTGVFAFVYWRGWAATGPYLNTPVWCQEALAVADRGK